MHDLIAILLIVEAVLFVVTIAMANRESTRLVGEYAGTGFHLLLLPVVATFPGGFVGQAAGVVWIACDVVAGMGLVWTAGVKADLGRPLFEAVRMAGHLFAAIWIALVSVRLGGVALPVGALLALGFAAYTLAAGRLPQKVLAVPGLLMVVWLVLLARHAVQVAG